jgi:hypothetical protein
MTGVGARRRCGDRAPLVLVLVARRPGDVMHRAGAWVPAARRGRVVAEAGPAGLAGEQGVRAVRLEAEGVQQWLGSRRARRVRADAVEALQGMLGRDVRSAAASGASSTSATTRASARPSGSVRSRRPSDRVTAMPAADSRSSQNPSASSPATRHAMVWIMPSPARPGQGARELEERQHGAGSADVVAVVEVVDVGSVEVHGLLDEAQARAARRRSRGCAARRR